MIPRPAKSTQGTPLVYLDVAGHSHCGPCAATWPNDVFTPYLAKDWERRLCCVTCGKEIAK